ncbi:NRX2A protein, partial [Stercorarius parasiticus]|nr:NRX2A protein [Stercorarius parasiticus]
SEGHLETEAHQGSVAHEGSQDHLEPSINDGSVAQLDLKVHQGSVASPASKGHQSPVARLDPKVHEISVANPGPVANPSPVAHVKTKVNQDPAARLVLKGHQNPTANRSPMAPLDLKVHQDPVANRSPMACPDLKVHHNSTANRGPTACLETKFHQDSVANWATPFRLRPRVPLGGHLGLVLLTLGSLLLPGISGAALEFGGAPGQWARYGRWAPGAGGQLSFSLKTNISRALLLYLDDGGNCDFLELLVAEGRLRLRFAIACAEPATVQPPPPVNDGRWHMVLLTRNARETSLAVDGE